MQHRKEKFKKKFRCKMGFLVDIVKPGYGTTNTGNSARRFFENSTASASITGIDENLIKDFPSSWKRFHVIME